MDLVRPAIAHLSSYSDALRRGWSPDNTRDAAAEELRLIAHDVTHFLESLTDPEAKGPSITLADGSPELPPHCLGHIGYAVVPWKTMGTRRDFSTASTFSRSWAAAVQRVPRREVAARY